ncbi:MAG: hypothetical protein ACRCSG_06545 [Cellulosilyticaceae bacterium]
MNQFKAFMEQVQDMEYELDKKLKDFTMSDFLELEDELDEVMFKDAKVIEKLKECGAITEIKKDAQTGGTFIKFENGKECIFGIN